LEVAAAGGGVAVVAAGAVVVAGAALAVARAGRGIVAPAGVLLVAAGVPAVMLRRWHDNHLSLRPGGHAEVSGLGEAGDARPGPELERRWRARWWRLAENGHAKKGP
jgi:uncharacterized membrane protein YhaH (DUF805 family)